MQDVGVLCRVRFRAYGQDIYASFTLSAVPAAQLLKQLTTMTRKQRFATVRRELRQRRVRGDALHLAPYLQPGFGETEETLFQNLFHCAFHANATYANYLRQFRRPKADRIRMQLHRLFANGLGLRRELVLKALTYAIEQSGHDAAMLIELRTIASAIDELLVTTRLFTAQPPN